jgi:4'-phosphopantetheinyl transferase
MNDSAGPGCVRASEERIDLWITRCGDVDDHLLGKYRALLPEHERRRQLCFVSELDRRRYLVTRALVRTVLSRYAPISPARWCFAFHPHGKPEIVGEHVACGVRFSVARSADVVLLAVTRRRELGVDVEAL